MEAVDRRKPPAIRTSRSSAARPKVDNGQTIPNPLYDPNYRKFDVEGYRIYRGRSDTPSALKLLVQFDYAGTTFTDFTGAVSRRQLCA